MKHILAFLSLAGLLAGCSDGVADSESDSAEPEPVVSASRSFGSSREDVGYRNPNTGYESDYSLDVDRDSEGNVERINFPNGGYEDDLVDQTDNGDGTVTVTDEDGREFTVDGGSGEE